jgi:hypothetical protein
VTVATIATVGPVLPKFEIKEFGWQGSPLPGSKYSESHPQELTPKLLAASLAQDIQVLEAEPVGTHNLDGYCWPHSTAMTGAEINTFTARVTQINDKGAAPEASEGWAEKLLQRDREQDDRTLCLECRHLGGSGPSTWRCGNWRKAGIAIRARDADLSRDLVQLLQRCPGFNAGKI